MMKNSRWGAASFLVPMVVALGSTAVYAAQFTEGMTNFIGNAGVPVAEGVLTTPGGTQAQRKTYFKQNHYAIEAGREVGVYYATWSVYGRKYSPHNVPVERLSEIYVAFGGICGDNPGAYEAGSGLKKTCANMHGGSDNANKFLPGITSLQDGEANLIDDPWGFFDLGLVASDGSKSSQLEGMMQWKQRNPNLKVIWSIGGWSYSKPFYTMIASPSTRAKFVDSVAKWLNQPAFSFVDGIDLDFEFPGGGGLDAGMGSPMDGANYTLLVKELRTKLDQLSTAKNKKLLLTAAIGVGNDKLDNWAKSAKISDMMPSLDRLGLMTYDFAGAWDTNVGFNTAMKMPPGAKTKVNSALNYNVTSILEQMKTQHGITDALMPKISLGIGFYGRSQGGIAPTTEPKDLPGAPSSGGGTGGTVENSSFSFFDLYENYIGSTGKGVNGWKLYRYPEFGASLLYNKDKGQAISLSTPDDVIDMVKFARDKKMRGVFAWQVDDDNGMLLEAIHKGYSHKKTTITPGKKVVYAPECTPSMKFMPGTNVTMAGQLYSATGWPTKCPGQGEAWEQATWKSMGAVGNYQIVGSTGSGGSGAGAAGAAGSGGSGTGGGAGAVGSGGSGAGAGSGSSNSSSAPAWVRGREYGVAGTVVSHNNQTWVNQWWTSGEPGVDGAWKSNAPQVPGGAWIKGGTYDKPGTVVTHMGSTWQNKWWTNGEPGVDAAWAKK